MFRDQFEESVYDKVKLPIAERVPNPAAFLLYFVLQIRIFKLSAYAYLLNICVHISYVESLNSRDTKKQNVQDWVRVRALVLLPKMRLEFIKSKKKKKISERVRG